MDDNLARDAENFLSTFQSFRDKIVANISNLTDNDDFVKGIKCVNADLTEKRIDNMIALHHGQAMQLMVIRGNEKVPVAVPNGSKVNDVFSAVADAINERLDREGEEYRTHTTRLDKHDKAAIVRAFSVTSPPKRLNWRRFWRTHCLISNEVILKDRDVPVNNVPGLVNGAVLRFARRNRKKG
ncbi:hypothetical protein ECG_00793 [Echinococcus granulosus]|uniref:Expressed conserved protein n=1 Tax=Echinococcus granulosus TaxID=6210 RepID=A0A068W9M4_ECHGR|nr:hypothetical protein ECG_00793 [Echinococcus granulosus]CDS16339.1 expressed conserved protein [Echinococcus granulosus]